MAKYLLLIHGDEREWASMSAQEHQDLVEGHRAFVEAAVGESVGARRVHPAVMDE